MKPGKGTYYVWVFLAGELWGHIGHGVAWTHVALSLGLSFFVLVNALKIPWKDMKIVGKKDVEFEWRKEGS